MKNPVEALETAILAGLSDHHAARRFRTPGSVITGMSGATRECLGQLRARDIASLRQDVVALYIEPDPNRELKVRFDRRLLARCSAGHDDPTRRAGKH